jgi:hypothetical protein
MPTTAVKAAAMKTATAPPGRRSRRRRQNDGRGHRKRRDPGDKRLRNPDHYNLHIDPAAEPPDELFATGSTLGVFSMLPTNSGGLTVTRRLGGDARFVSQGRVYRIDPEWLFIVYDEQTFRTAAAAFMVQFFFT